VQKSDQLSQLISTVTETVESLIIRLIGGFDKASIENNREKDARMNNKKAVVVFVMLSAVAGCAIPRSDWMPMSGEERSEQKFYADKTECLTLAHSQVQTPEFTTVLTRM